MFPSFGFSIQEYFIYCYFYCQKTASVCEFQHTFLWKLMLFSRFHTLCGHEILWTCTHLGHLTQIRIQRHTFHIYLKKWSIWTQKDCCAPWTGAKQKIVNFECYDLAM
jgi:hypothetical protein